MNGGFVTSFFKKQADEEESCEMKFGLARVVKYQELKKATNSFDTELGHGGYGRVYLDQDNDSCATPIEILHKEMPAISLAELRRLTGNFGEKAVIGEGPYYRIFKATLSTGEPAAIKKLGSNAIQYNGALSKVNFLGRLSHPNFVKLLGYCFEDKELLLAYEFMGKGTLENHLFGNTKESIICNIPVPECKRTKLSQTWLDYARMKSPKGAAAYDPLSWDVRLKIAIGAARGLAFLHSSKKQVIYGDFKASNIFLDWSCNAKLSDSRLATYGPTDEMPYIEKEVIDPGVIDTGIISTELIGMSGYEAPEYIASGHLYVKSDVYGFGVVLLEMLTGKRTIDQSRPRGEHNLADWAKSYLADRRKLAHLMDPRLKGQYPSKGAFHAAQLTLKCLTGDPKNRPSMKEVVETLEHIEALNNAKKGA